MNAPKSPSMRTPLARVRALGASHSGTSDFWRQRLTAVAMTVLVWIAAYAFGGGR